MTSDSGAVADIYQNHHFTSNWTETVAKAVIAGCDVESASWPPDHPWATDGPYLSYLPDAVKAGLLPEAAIDTALRNFMLALPCVADLRSPAMRPRHWEQLMQVLLCLSPVIAPHLSFIALKTSLSRALAARAQRRHRKRGAR